MPLERNRLDLLEFLNQNKLGIYTVPAMSVSHDFKSPQPFASTVEATIPEVMAQVLHTFLQNFLR